MTEDLQNLYRIASTVGRLLRPSIRRLPQADRMRYLRGFVQRNPFLSWLEARKVLQTIKVTREEWDRVKEQAK